MRLTTTLCLTALSVTTAGVAAELPTAAEVLRGYEEALGGRAAFAALKGLKKTGTYIYNGLEFPIVSYQVRDARRRDEIEGLTQWATTVREGVTVVLAVDGKAAWVSGSEESPEPHLLTPNQTLQAIREAAFESPLLAAADKGHGVQVVGREDVEGTPVWKLRVTLAEGGVEQWYLGVEDFLPRRRNVEPAQGQDSYQAGRVWHFDDYRAVAGVPVPHWVHVEEALFSREYAYDTIEPDVDLADDLFTPPPGVGPPPAED